MLLTDHLKLEHSINYNNVWNKFVKLRNRNPSVCYKHDISFTFIDSIYHDVILKLIYILHLKG